jgi:ribonuclease HI
MGSLCRYGSSANQKSGIGVTLDSLEGEKFQYAIKLDFITMNNEAEYEVVLAGLSIAREMGAKNLEIRSDSQVVVNHI